MQDYGLTRIPVETRKKFTVPSSLTAQNHLKRGRHHKDPPAIIITYMYFNFHKSFELLYCVFSDCLIHYVQICT
jgi:hypothetical protein